MEKKKQIGEHIVDHLSERMNEEIVDPVLDEWLAEDESNQEDFKRYKEIWKETGSYLEQETFNAQYAWDKIDRINKKRYNKRKRLVNIGYIISGVAATLLLVLGFSKMGVFDKQPEMLVRMTADYGSRSEVVLPDGSVVKLNSGSDITYSYNAKEKIREVNFQGEGFFDVSKNKIPFVIKMNNGLRLKVHGTSFNLQAYTDEKTVEASLVEGGTEEDMKTFYSCMFRANLFSHKFYEEKEDGSPYYYSPYDEKIHDGYMFTDNGFWDTFRSQFPLTNILHPTMQGQYMQALLDAQEQCGWLPSWSFPSETGGMVGNHSISLLTDAWVKGIRTFDPEKALKAYAHEAMNKGPWGGANGRVRWKDYYQLGYIPYPESMGSTAQTLEYCYDDFCAYQLAKMTGNKFYEEVFARQIYNYKNVYDPSVGFMRGRKLDGSWADFDAFEWGGPYCEGNAWHYNWSVFHDVQGLIDLTGGDERFVAKIDSVFALPGIVKYGTYGTKIHEMLEMELAKMGQYAQGNQPIQHMIYLYSYAGQPWKTQYWIRQVMDRLYNSSENGYPGDEDQGGMSSWYVLSALGIYSVCPGTDEYVLGSPKFRKATITMEDGKKFVIEAKGNSKDNVYIQNATLNGKRHTRNYIHYSDIVNGGVLELQMGNQPEKTRGTAKEDRPFSLSK